MKPHVDKHGDFLNIKVHSTGVTREFWFLLFLNKENKSDSKSSTLFKPTLLWVSDHLHFGHLRLKGLPPNRFDGKTCLLIIYKPPVTDGFTSSSTSLSQKRILWPWKSKRQSFKGFAVVFLYKDYWFLYGFCEHQYQRTILFNGLWLPGVVQYE